MGAKEAMFILFRHVYIIQTFSEVAGVPHFVTDSGSIGIDEIRVFSANSSFPYVFSGEVGIEKIVMGTGLLAQADKSDVSPIWIDARLDYGVAIEGNAGDNQVSGTLFNDSIAGGDGNDFLAGRAGDDSIQGGNGADNILGGLGSDTLSGGDGIDGFLFYSIFDTVVGVGRDQITDYNPLFDAISLSAIDADVTISGDQAFTFIGNNIAFSNAAGQLRFDSVTHFLSGDVNGDATADFEIALIGITSISVSNSFIFL